jgi:hypothetical protein
MCLCSACVDLGLLHLEFGEDLFRLVALGDELGPVTSLGRIAGSLDRATRRQQAEMRFAEQMGRYGALFSRAGSVYRAWRQVRPRWSPRRPE